MAWGELESQIDGGEACTGSMFDECHERNRIRRGCAEKMLVLKGNRDTDFEGITGVQSKSWTVGVDGFAGG